MGHLDNNAVTYMTERGRAALPHETGGILLGWTDTTGRVWIDRAIEVPAATSGTYHYERTSDVAQAALDTALAGEPEGSPVGYVGEWHTHPAPAGPSDVDLDTLRGFADDAGHTLALVVLALQPDQSWGVWTEWFAPSELAGVS
jgi:proteasome lid subunit RPN8/RPN11